MSMSREEWKDVRRDTGRGFILVVAVVLAAIVLSVGGVILYQRTAQPEIIKNDRQNERVGNENSQQYVETQVRAMRDQLTQYDTNAVNLAVLQKDPSGNAEVIEQLNTAQNGIVTFVRQQALTIPASAVPSDIQEFIRAH
jgi:competence protein ComGC